MRPRLPLPFLLLAPLVRAQFKNDFSSYPAGTRICLKTASDKSGCAGKDFKEMNGCLCANGGNFITDSAACIGRQSPRDLESVYDQMAINCNGSGDAVTISKQKYLDIGRKAADTTPAPDPGATTTPDPGAATTTEPPPPASGTGEADTEPSGPALATGEIVAVAVVSLIAVAMVAAGMFVLFRRRRAAKGPREEAHPMLGQQPPASGPSPGPYPDHDGAVAHDVGAGAWSKAAAAKSAAAAPSPNQTWNLQYHAGMMAPAPSPTAAAAANQWGQPAWNPHASWVSVPGVAPGQGPPPSYPGYDTAYQGHGPQLYEMPNTPALPAAGVLAPGNGAVEMDAGQTLHRSEGATYITTGQGR